MKLKHLVQTFKIKDLKLFVNNKEVQTEWLPNIKQKSENNLKIKHSDKIEKYPHIIMFNARSIRNKIDELIILTTTHKPNLILITESWLNSWIPNSILKIDDYKIIRNDRKHKKGGGVCAYIHKDTTFVLEELSGVPPNINIIAFSAKNFIYILIYIPPNLLANENLEIINFLIKTYDEHLIKCPDKYIIICGDFNKIDIKYLEIHHNLLNIYKFTVT